MRSLVFEGGTWAVYEQLRIDNKRLHKKLCGLIKEMLRDPTKGTGKPEPLKHQYAGLWSRRLSQSERVIYRHDESALYIFAIGGHYES